MHIIQCCSDVQVSLLNPVDGENKCELKLGLNNILITRLIVIIDDAAMKYYLKTIENIHMLWRNT